MLSISIYIYLHHYDHPNNNNVSGFHLCALVEQEIIKVMKFIQSRYFPNTTKYYMTKCRIQLFYEEANRKCTKWEFCFV